MKIILFLVSVFLFASCNTQRNLNRKFVKQKTEIAKELRQMVKNDQEFRINADSLRNVLTKKRYDSIWNLQQVIDKKNVLRLIEITEKYGFPNVDRLGEPIPAWLIFHHSPLALKSKILPLLENELKYKRMPHNELMLIKWHLNGRKGVPLNLDGVEVIDLTKKKDTLNEKSINN